MLFHVSVVALPSWSISAPPDPYRYSTRVNARPAAGRPTQGFDIIAERGVGKRRRPSQAVGERKEVVGRVPA